MQNNEIIDAVKYLFPKQKDEVKDFVNNWLEQNVPLWAIMMAYGETVKRCDVPSIRYMAVIIRNWIDQVNSYEKEEPWKSVIESSFFYKNKFK